MLVNRSLVSRVLMIVSALAFVLAMSGFGVIGSDLKTSGRPQSQLGGKVTLAIGKERDITIIGVAREDRSGFGVASADINGDGAEDLIVGATEANPAGVFGAGGTYVIFGPLEAGTLALSTAPDITISGIDVQDYSGSAVAVGDLNNDGAVDLIIGAYQAKAGERLNAGVTYVLFGPLEVGMLGLSTSADIIINGADKDDLSGKAVAVGDINNDGIEDLIIGAQSAQLRREGETYVFFGPLEAGTLDAATDPDITIGGIDTSDFSGSGVASGDVNNDGAEDLVIGAQSADPGGRDDAGEAYVVFGPLEAGRLELSSAADITINGREEEDCLGSAMTTGDMNGDGVEDLVIGAMGADAGSRLGAGQAYVLLGPLSAGTIEVSTAADMTIDGARSVDRLGASLATGDINDDGTQDLIIGATGADPHDMKDAGETYVLLGGLFDREPSGAGVLVPVLLGLFAAGGVGAIAVLVLWWQRRSRNSPAGANQKAPDE